MVIDVATSENMQGYLYARGWTQYAGLWRDPNHVDVYDMTLAEAVQAQQERERDGNPSNGVEAPKV